MHPSRHGNRLQSLAEATVEPGTRTQLHRHALTEELYHVSAGCGLMTLGDTCFAIAVGALHAGDSALCPAGTVSTRTRAGALHAGDSASRAGNKVLIATGSEPLCILCCSSPPYSHDDTGLSEYA